MDKKTKNLLLLAGVVVAGVYLYRRSQKNSTSSFSNAGGGMMQCMCTDKYGNTRPQNCRKKHHADCESCCGHYGKDPSRGAGALH